MANNRAKAEEFIIANIDKLAPGGMNKKLYMEKFSKMNDDEFKQFMKDLKEGVVRLAVIAPNFSKHELSLKRNFALAKELGHDFFKQIWVPESNDTPGYLTPKKYPVFMLPIRRQAQLLDKKIGIPEDNNSINNITNQPTGKSKGGRISYPEVQVLTAMNLEKSLIGLMKYRGGDEKGFNAMNTMILRTGRVSQDAIEPYSGTVKSTQSLSIYLAGMHLKNNLLK